MRRMKQKIFLGILLLVAIGISGCSFNRNRPRATEQPNEGVTYERGVDFVGVVRAIDTDLTTIEFYNASFDKIESYPYSGATALLTKNENQLAISEIEPGEVFDVYTSEDGRRIVKLQETSGVSLIEDTTVRLHQEKNYLTIQDMNYSYTERLPVFSNGKLIQPMEITAEDKITFRGTKGQAYSIIVTRGHGYIQPKNYADFLGGIVTVRGEMILPVSKNMLLTVPEGLQLFTMNNGDLTSEASVEVKRGQVTEVNMAQFRNQVPDTARVRCKISPEGAELYVNGILKDSSKPISLKYGNHSIKVELEGYNNYTGVIHVQDPNLTIKIDLAEEKAEVEEEDSSSSVSEKDTPAASSTPAATYDKEHKITVSAPNGAAVYIDGTYKGVAPCSFTKIIGNVTITLAKEGYETKSYSIQLSDDSQDVTWSFPDLEKKGKG